MNDDTIWLRFHRRLEPHVTEGWTIPTADHVAALPLVVPLGATANAQPAGIHT
jgi:hypothetical protein